MGGSSPLPIPTGYLMGGWEGKRAGAEPEIALRQFRIRAYEMLNFISLIASLFTTAPPMRFTE